MHKVCKRSVMYFWVRSIPLQTIFYLSANLSVSQPCSNNSLTTSTQPLSDARMMAVFEYWSVTSGPAPCSRSSFTHLLCPLLATTNNAGLMLWVLCLGKSSKAISSSFIAKASPLSAANEREQDNSSALKQKISNKTCHVREQF